MEHVKNMAMLAILGENLTFRASKYILYNIHIEAHDVC